MILLVYGPLLRADFLLYDDPAYVTKNATVQTGFTWTGIRWAFTDIQTGCWHPLAWISLMLDAELYGLNPGGYHFTNLLLHILNTLLLFILLQRTTGSLWRSIVVAALFALHPLHVESVAWVSERKDVLSTFFGMLALLCYVLYCERPGVLRYSAILLTFLLALMAKPIWVTLPFVLLLLDYWPLRRILGSRIEAGDRNRRFGWLILEKAPLLLLTIAASIITYLASQKVGALVAFQTLPFPDRLANAVISYGIYLGKAFWPMNLSVFYPHPGVWGLRTVLLVSLLLLLVTVIIVHLRRTQPYLLTGWLWYLGTLVPVIGIIQVGAQALSDRYTYLPLTGLFIGAVWWISSLFNRWARYRILPAAAAFLILSLLAVRTWDQVSYWRNGEALFSHALAVTTDNYVAHSNMGAVLFQQNRFDESVRHYREAVRIQPRYDTAWCGLGATLQAQGREEEAVMVYLQALSVDPDFSSVHYALAKAYDRLGRHADAAFHFREVLRLLPNVVSTYNDLALSLAQAGKTEEALRCYREALRQRPYQAGYHNNYGMLLMQQGRRNEAEREFREALRLQPDYANAHYQLARLLQARRVVDEADLHMQAARRINAAYGEWDTGPRSGTGGERGGTPSSDRTTP
jgi:tetratricopeptide (TPR) repeat protein